MSLRDEVIYGLKGRAWGRVRVAGVGLVGVGLRNRGVDVPWPERRGDGGGAGRAVAGGSPEHPQGEAVRHGGKRATRPITEGWLAGRPTLLFPPSRPDGAQIYVIPDNPSARSRSQHRLRRESAWAT